MTDSRSADTPERWGAASRGYADHVAPRLMSAFVESFVDRLGVESTTRALEVGAGSGALTEVLAPRVEALLATDFAPLMIEVLEERLLRAGIANVECRVMDGQDLDLDDDSMDAAASSFAVVLFPDRAKGFGELRRVVRPGGRVVVSGWAGPDRFETFGLFLAGLQAAFPDMPPPPAPPAVFSLSDPVAFKRGMETAGFRDVEVDLEARGMSVPDFDEMWRMLTIGAPPIQVLFDRVGPAGRDRLRDRLASIVDERFGGGPIELTNVATVGSGIST